MQVDLYIYIYCHSSKKTTNACCFKIIDYIYRYNSKK